MMESIRTTSLQAENADFVVAAITEYIAARLGVSAELLRSTSDLMGSQPLNLALRFLLEAYCLGRHRVLAAISWLCWFTPS
jgi:hypothetical protein